MRRLIPLALILALGAGAARAATPAEVLCASYKAAIAKQPDRAKREAMARSAPAGCEVRAPARKPPEPARPARPAPAKPAPPKPKPAPPPPPAPPPLPPEPVAEPITPIPGGLAPDEVMRNGNKAYAQHKYPDALRWFRMAADHGYAPAQAAIGDFYFNGRGLPRDYDQAMAWYKRAADNGSATADEAIGSLYARGQGVGLDYGEAIKWFRRAAAKGNADAMNWLGALYEHGQGVAKDPAQADAWYAKARSARPSR